MSGIYYEDERIDGPLHERKECSVETVRNFDLVCVLSKENNAFVDKFADDQSKDLAKVPSRDEFL